MASSVWGFRSAKAWREFRPLRKPYYEEERRSLDSRNQKSLLLRIFWKRLPSTEVSAIGRNLKYIIHHIKIDVWKRNLEFFIDIILQRWWVILSKCNVILNITHCLKNEIAKVSCVRIMRVLFMMKKDVWERERESSKEFQFKTDAANVCLWYWKCIKEWRRICWRMQYCWTHELKMREIVAKNRVTNTRWSADVSDMKFVGFYWLIDYYLNRMTTH